MKLAGIVTAHRGKRILIAQTDAGQLPPLYAQVADETDRHIGKIVDLYGNVAQPYISILGEDEDTVKLGTELYVLADSVPKHEKKYHRYKKKLR